MPRSKEKVMMRQSARRQYMRLNRESSTYCKKETDVLKRGENILVDLVLEVLSVISIQVPECIL